MSEPYIPAPIPSNASPEVQRFLAEEFARIAYFLNNLETGGSGATELSGLSDVNTSTPTDRNALIADGVDWESRALVEADISDLGSYGTLNNIVEDTTPQLGGNLDVQNYDISNVGNLEIRDAGGTDFVDIYHTGAYLVFNGTNTIVYQFKLDHSSGYNLFNRKVYIRNDLGSNSELVIGNGSAQANNSNDGKIVLYGEHNNTTYGVQLNVASSNFGLVGTTSGCDAAVATLQFATNFQMTAGKDFSMIGGGLFWARDAAQFRVGDATDSDWGEQTHDGIDYNWDFTNTADLNIDGLSGDILVDGDYVPVSSDTTGGSGSAGSGNQYVELEINGSIYKLLHDGTV